MLHWDWIGVSHTNAGRNLLVGGLKARADHVWVGIHEGCFNASRAHDAAAVIHERARCHLPASSTHLRDVGQSRCYVGVFLLISLDLGQWNGVSS